MEYYNYPEEKIDIFATSDKDYFIKVEKFTYLCSMEEIYQINMKTALSGYVLVIYQRYAVVNNGKVIYRNENFYDDFISKGRYKGSGYVIISNIAKDYYIHSWKKALRSYELRDASGYNQALNPQIYNTAEAALQKALECSGNSSETLVIARWFDEFDRH